MLFFLLSGCAAYKELFNLLDEDPVAPCTTRAAWWEDADGDGAGNPGEQWISCTQPDGWVENADDCDDADATRTTGCDTGPADTGPADTGPADTGPADTGPADSGAADSGAAPRPATPR